MKTTERFERAVTKLYNAFHKGKLNSFDCHACAVGTMCDGDGEWFFRSSRKLFGEPVFPSLKAIETGYSEQELGIVEKIFMTNVPYSMMGNRDTQFKGLCAVIEYLCQLDGIPNVMDYSSLFEYDDKGAKKELKEVFQWKTT